MLKINWKTKSFIFRIIDFFDAQRILYWLQRYVTRRAVIQINRIEDSWKMHEKCIKRYDFPNVLEFGSGKDLAQNIYLSSIAYRQTCIDINPMLEIDLFNNAALQISKIIPDIKYNKCSCIEDIFDFYSIEYLSPFILDGNNFKKNSIDVCISTNTMEHIPEKQIKELLKNVHISLKQGGAFSAKIDYSDHYASTDSLGLLNFLSYSEIEWKKYNHECHYQNRLRHSDYRSLIEEAGYEIVEDIIFDRSELPKNVSTDFDLNDETINAINGYFCAIKN